jgi:hypothetical protein
MIALNASMIAAAPTTRSNATAPHTMDDKHTYLGYLLHIFFSLDAHQYI